MVINTLDRLIQILTLQAANLPTYQAEVGATAADIQAVTDELANLVYMVDYAALIDTNKKTVFQIKQAAYNGLATDTIPPYPVFPVCKPPISPLVAGSLSRTIDRNARFRAASGYTHEIGVALGLTDATPTPPTPANIKPTVDAFAAQTGYMFSVVVANRGISDMWDVLVLQKGSATWTVAKSATGKSADVIVIPVNPGDPEQIQVRIQLKKSNDNYGQLSDIIYVTINP